MYYSRVFKPHSVPGRKCSLPASVTGYQPLIHYSTCWSKATHSLSLCLDRRGWCAAAVAGLWPPMTSLFFFWPFLSFIRCHLGFLKIKQFVVNMYFFCNKFSSAKFNHEHWECDSVRIPDHIVCFLCFSLAQICVYASVDAYLESHLQ